MAKKFENILDQCIERLLPGDTLEEWLQDYPEQAAVVAVFVFALVFTASQDTL